MTEERLARPAPETTCRRLGELAAAACPDDGKAPDARLFARIEARLGAGAPEGPARRWRWRWPALAAAAVAVACTVGWLAARRTLPYEVEGCSATTDGVWRAAGAGRVAFADGSRLELEPGAGVRIEPLAFARGARLNLEEGKVEVAVVPRRDARWAVLAGPFRVDVTGTRFSVRWTRDAGRFRLEMSEGQVRVSGGPLPTEVGLRAGQALEAEAGRFAVTDVPARASAPAPARPAMPGSEAAPGAPLPMPAESAAATPSVRPRPTLRRPAAARRIAVRAPADLETEAVAQPPVGELTLPALVGAPPSEAPPAPRVPGVPSRVSIGPDGQLSRGMTGFAWIWGGEGTVFSFPIVKDKQARLSPEDGRLCARGRLARWACVNEGMPHVRCNWDRNWGVAVGFFVRHDRSAWGADAPATLAIDYHGRSTTPYRLVAHRKGDPDAKTYCFESYKSGQVVRPHQLKSRCWDDAGEALPDFEALDSIALQALPGHQYVAFRYCIEGVTLSF